MSNKNKYGGKMGGTKRRRKQYLAEHGDTEFAMQPPVRKQKKVFEAKTPSQKEYVKAIDSHDIIFADGRAGSGKTFAATAMGIKAVLAEEYERLIITRPVLEAGENLGFLPGKAAEKIGPYMRPIFDALHYFLSPQEVATLQNRGKIEVAPLAYMRGRTFEDSFIIVDEAQNCSMKQLKMAITRLGQNSKLIVNGDVSQSDLPEGDDNALAMHFKKFTKAKHPRIVVYKFAPTDIIRNALIADYLDIMEKE